MKLFIEKCYYFAKVFILYTQIGKKFGSGTSYKFFYEQILYLITSTTDNNKSGGCLISRKTEKVINKDIQLYKKLCNFEEK